jgi:hypothetical protein
MSNPLDPAKIQDLLNSVAGRFKSLPELKDAVVANDNVLTVTMQDLRDAYGALRLGVNVRSDITKKLSGHGLGHYPPELPAYQDQLVRLFTLGSPVADVIHAVLTPAPEHDELLRSKVGTDEATVLEQIRALVS